MQSKELEDIFFKNKTKGELIDITVTSIRGLLADIFEGKDINQLRNEFPPHTQINNIELQLNAISVHINHKDVQSPSIEFSVAILHKGLEQEIGLFSCLFDMNCELLNEIFNLY
ncbi:MAG: hypothetical protein MI739_04360 [Bacteroidales bacterium]|nr:hypothetical protein [Bacteroidales bacterium]